MTKAEKVVSFLSKNGYSITAAESCTGGLISSAITEVSGSSAVFEAGFVTYSEKMKTAMVGVPEGILSEFGVYSSQTVEAMAKGAAHKTGANVAIATSGVAGPAGGTAENPVGRVYICILVRDVFIKGERKDGTFLYKEDLSGSRGEIRRAAVEKAFEYLLSALEL